MVRITKNRSDRRRGFTLVEMIIILVILSVLAAMIVPSLSGYVRTSKEQGEQAKALLAMDSMQVVMNNLRLKKLAALTPGSADWTSASSNDTNKALGDQVISSMGLSRDTEPYLLVIGCGDSSVYEKDPAKRYTVYFVAYAVSEDSDAWFYVSGGEWTHKNPLETGTMTAAVTGDTISTNIAKVDGANVGIQLYVISNHAGGNVLTVLNSYS